MANSTSNWPPLKRFFTYDKEGLYVFVKNIRFNCGISGQMIAFWWHDLRARTCFPLSWHSSLIIYGRSFLSNHFLFATSKGALSFPATLIFIKVSKLTHPPDFSIGRRRERKSEVSSFGFNVVFVSSFFMKSFAWLVCSLPSYSMDHDHVALISWMLYNEPLVFKWQTNSFFWKFQKLRLSVVSSTQDHSNNL